MFVLSQCKRESGPDAADKMNNSVVICKLQVFCLLSVEEMPEQTQTELIHVT